MSLLFNTLTTADAILVSTSADAILVFAGYEPPVQRSDYSRRDPRFDFGRRDPRAFRPRLALVEELACLAHLRMTGTGRGLPPFSSAPAHSQI